MKIDTTRLDAMNRLGRAMADPTRSAILLSLLESPNYPAVLARTLNLTRANVSNHLACLRGCGIVSAQQHGRQTLYSIADESLVHHLLSLLDTFTLIDERRDPDVCPMYASANRDSQKECC